MRRGFTLPEVLLVLTCIGLATAVAVPGLRSGLERAATEDTAQRLAAAHRRARLTAVVESRVSLLTVTADSITLRVVEGADTVRRWHEPGPRASAVTLTGPARALTFAPIGLTMGLSNATYVLTRGGATRRVVVSRLGRVRIGR